MRECSERADDERGCGESDQSPAEGAHDGRLYVSKGAVRRVERKGREKEGERKRERERGSEKEGARKRERERDRNPRQRQSHFRGTEQRRFSLLPIHRGPGPDHSANATGALI
jgi:hypothetical protein